MSCEQWIQYQCGRQLANVRKLVSYSSQVMLAAPVAAIWPVDFSQSISVQASAIRVEHCSGSYFSITHVDKVGKQLGGRFYSMWHLR